VSDILQLAGRCEKVTVSDRQLDGDIAEALLLFPRDERWVRMLPERHGGTSREPWRWYVPIPKWKDGERWPVWDAPRFTDSLDSAMSLMPGGSVWTIEERCAWVRLLDDRDPEGVVEYQSMAATTPLAICAAILKARAGRALVGSPKQ
jgi:hypothetical protein